MELTKEFRLDINGLRAIAVLLVLIFHIEPNYLKAGFLGVDIFLVISGYLITKSIFFDLSKGGLISESFSRWLQSLKKWAKKYCEHLLFRCSG